MNQAIPIPESDPEPVSEKTITHDATSSESHFHIVGVGMSAGGLDALEILLKSVPATCGCAWVIVQHLDPQHPPGLVEILQRFTGMRVAQITDGVLVEPNVVYVIPPKWEVSLLNRVLHLSDPLDAHGPRLPIDTLFRSLAVDLREHSIAVVLSGMGTDGTQGARTIKKHTGAVFVQTPTSAKYGSMPRSVIDAGLADIIAPIEVLAHKLLAYVTCAPPMMPRPELSLADADHNGIAKILLILRAVTGHDFSRYKKSTLYRRIERRMSLHQLLTINDYVRYMRENIDEAKLLFQELLIGVTSFFRDPSAWEQLKTTVLPVHLAALPNGGLLRAWCPASSSGEEAYTLAIIFREALEEQKLTAHYRLQIFATDLDEHAIDTARNGLYPFSIAADVSEVRLRRFFLTEDRGYRIAKEIREMVIFAPQNVIMDPPFTKLDLVTCRNLMIYLEADLQKRILPLFHYCLNAGGTLMLGNSETIGTSTELFTALPGTSRLYRRLETVFRSDLLEFPASASTYHLQRPAIPMTYTPSLTSQTTPNLQVLAEALVLQKFTAPAVLTTSAGDVVYIHGRIGNFLEPASGKASLNVFAMARNGLREALNDSFARAVRTQTTITLPYVVIGNGSESTFADVIIHYLNDPEPLRGLVLIIFTSVAARVVPEPADNKPYNADDQLHSTALSKELQLSREELLVARREMQTSQEELKSTNEELQSTNEELQSTNEELTTSKEEMQSMNEELQIVNRELQAKLEELSRASDDMKNLLNSTDIATLFLDDSLHVRRFTTQTTGIIQLIAGDVGRPITDLVSILDYPALANDAHEVLRSLVFHEKQVSARDGRWFRVRIMPYRTQDNRIDGAVITFVDITETKKMETTLREMLATQHVRDSHQP